MLNMQSVYIETLNERPSHSRLETIKRFAQVVPGALAVTLTLILAMEYLIQVEPIDVPEQKIYAVPNPVMVEPPEIETRRERPTPPEPVEEIPDVPDLAVVVDVKNEQGPQNYAPRKRPITPALNSYSSNTPIATVLVQPDYPARALSKGLEGYVDVRFDVSPMGTTYNIVVTHAQPKNIFNKAAVKAVKNWKFQPVRIQGEAKSYSGMEQRITFQMES